MAVTENKMTTAKVPLRVARVIELFEREGADPKAVAKKLKFENHRDLGRFMKLHGYVWSTERGNYVREGQPEEQPENDSTPSQEANQLKPVAAVDENPEAPPSPASLESYRLLLEYLARHQERLQDLLGEGISPAPSGAIPRYTVPGVLATKSVHMNHDLDLLVRSFSKERNISQREIFEVALVEFFRRYGFAQEVVRLLEGG